MNRLRTVAASRVAAFGPAKRKFSNWFQKNIYIEVINCCSLHSTRMHLPLYGFTSFIAQENAGMREKSVETFQLTPGNCFEFFVFIVVPGYFMYDIGVSELVSKCYSLF